MPHNYLAADELFEWMEENEDLCLIDVLPAEHFKKIHLPKAKNACVFKVDFLEEVAKIVADKRCELIVYGTSIRSMDSHLAATKLTEAGYEHISIFRGGIETWLEKDFTIIGEKENKTLHPDNLTTPKNRKLNVDATQCSIEWTGRNQQTSHHGNIEISDGKLLIVDGNISGFFNMDMVSISNLNLAGSELQQVLIDHLKSNDFLNTSKFSKARYTITEAQPKDQPFATIPNYKIQGTLELCGVSTEQNFIATVSTTDLGEVTLEAHFDMDRTRWDIIYGSARFFESLGMHHVFDFVTIQLRLVWVDESL